MQRGHQRAEHRLSYLSSSSEPPDDDYFVSISSKVEYLGFEGDDSRVNGIESKSDTKELGGFFDLY